MNRRLFLAAVASAAATTACAREQPAGSASRSAADELNEAVRPPRATAVAARQWLENNARQAGVQVLPSGVQYRVVTSGPATGPHPGRSDDVKVNYEGALTDGSVFDSTFPTGVPAILPLDQLIPAWQEVIPMMRRGDEWIIWVPPAQGYGAEGRPPRIPPDSVLVFRMQLVDFLPRRANA